MRLLGLTASLKVMNLGGSGPESLFLDWILPCLGEMTAASSLRSLCTKRSPPAPCPWWVTYLWEMTCAVSVFKPPHIMQQCCRDHVRAVLPHHEIQTGGSRECRQWSFHSLQGKPAQEPRACSDACFLKIILKATVWQQGLKWALFIFLVLRSLPHVLVRLVCYNKITTDWVAYKQ